MLKKFALAIVAIILLLMVAVFLFAKDIEISVNEIEAQSAIDNFLTLNNSQSLGVKVSPKYILIDFKADNIAQIKSEMTLNGHGYNVQFDGKFSTGIDYRIPRLYLNELQLIEGGFRTDDETKSELNDLKNAAINALQRNRESRETQNTGNSYNKTSEEIVEEFIISATKSFFEKIPIYDLRRSEKTGIAVSLALKDVRFIEDAAIITLSPVTALLRILAAIGFICFFIAWCLGPLILKILLSRSPKQNVK